MDQLRQFFQYHFANPNYLYFLISLVLLLVLPSIAPFVPFGDFILEITFGLVLLMAIIYTSRSYNDLILLGGIGTVLFILFSRYTFFQQSSILNPIFTLTFFGLVFIRLMQYVFQPKPITSNDVMALCAGYLVIGIIGAPFFFVIDLRLENAFSSPEGTEFYDLLYFSYITLTGVGYGDIVPRHTVAKSVALVIGIAGQLYLAILVGIIIGKFLANQD